MLTFANESKVELNGLILDTSGFLIDGDAKLKSSAIYTILE